MSDPPSNPSSPRLNAAVAEYFEAVERGETLDRAALLARYDDVAGELTEFFADHDHFAAAAKPIAARGEPTPRSRPGLEGTLPLAAAKPNSAVEPHGTVEPREPGDAWAEPGEEREPRLIGEYEVLAELGRGGMGVVYRARHVRLGRVVALKTILAGSFASDEDLQRFQAEAQAAAALDHPGIVPIFESGASGGLPYFAMPLVEGASLASCLEAGPLAPQVAARLLQKIVAAVAYAHSLGVIHRDLKPANILLSRPSGHDSATRLPADGKGGACEPAPAALEACEPKITDFGLAKRMDGAAHLTASGQILGTPSYMPPEQAAGRVHTVGAAADIYALGAILYALVTGRPPFLSDNPVEIILQVLEREPTLPSHLNHTVPRELEAICLKCLEKRPADRYATAADLGADLDRYLRREPPEARRPTVSQRVRRWIRRQPVLAAHVVGIAAPLAISQVVFLLHPAAEWLYHAKVTGVLMLWLAVSGVFQWLMQRQRSQPWPLYAWLAADAAMLTALLCQLVAPLGMLAGSYLLLICCAGLAGRSRLVAFTAAGALAAYLALLLLRPDAAQPAHYALVAATTIVLCGIVVGYQVWRIEVLREYYDDRRM